MGGTEPNQSTDITTAQAAAMSRVWDPVMAAQLTRGGMCCDALYYGDAGVGRPTIAEVGSVSEFEPPLAGGVMAAESPVGTMCPMHGSGNGYSTSTVGNVNQVNPKETLLLEGQAFYVSLAPSQYSLPLTSTTDETQSISRCGRLALVLLTPSTSTSCPTATATLMPASTISPRSVRNPLSRGLRSLVSSCRGPTWLWL